MLHNLVHKSEEKPIQSNQNKMFSAMLQFTGNMFSITFKIGVLICNLLTKLCKNLKIWGLSKLTIKHYTLYELNFSHIWKKKKRNFIRFQDSSIILFSLFMWLELTFASHTERYQTCFQLSVRGFEQKVRKNLSIIREINSLTKLHLYFFPVLHCSLVYDIAGFTHSREIINILAFLYK